MSLDFLKTSKMEDFANQLFVPTSLPSHRPSKDAASSWSDTFCKGQRPLLISLILVALAMVAMFFYFQSKITALEESQRKRMIAPPSVDTTNIQRQLNALKRQLDQTKRTMNSVEKTMYSDKVDDLLLSTIKSDTNKS